MRQSTSAAIRELLEQGHRDNETILRLLKKRGIEANGNLVNQVKKRHRAKGLDMGDVMEGKFVRVFVASDEKDLVFQLAEMYTSLTGWTINRPNYVRDIETLTVDDRGRIVREFG